MEKPRIMAHRGGDFFGTENSLKAVKTSLKHKVDIIELDIRKSSDNILFCYHGSVLEILLGNLHFKKPLKNLKKKYPDLATLREVLEVIQGQTDIYLDIKDGTITSEDLKKVFKNIKTKQVYVGSLRFNYLRKLKVPKEWKKSLCGLIFPSINIKKIKRAGIHMVQLYSWNSTKKNLNLLKKNNLEFILACWFSNQEKFIKKALKKSSLWIWSYDLPALIKKIRK